MATFNVLTEPWIPVADTEGRVVERGVLDTLKSAHELARIVAPSPPIQFGLYRMLIAFVIDAFGIRELEDIEEMLDRRLFDENRLADYVAECGDCFDLFGPERPFLQSPVDADDNLKPKPIAALVQHLPSGTFATHFHHHAAVDHALSPEACARALCAIAPFMTSGGAGFSPSINGIPPWYLLVRGETLWETLVLNCCGLPLSWTSGSGIPAWRSPEQVVARQESRAKSLLEGLTWRPRLVRLFPSDGGRCTYTGLPCETLVREMIFSPGLRAAVENADWTDHQVAYQISDDGKRPLRPREGQQLWRDVGPLLLLREEDYTSPNGKVRFERPLVASQFVRLQETAALSRERPLLAECYGIRTDGKMKIFEWQRESLSLPASILRNPHAGEQVQDAMDLAARAEYFLRQSVKLGYPREGKGNPKAFGQLVHRALDSYSSRVRQRFELIFLDELARQAPDNLDAPAQLRDSWVTVLRREGARSLALVLDDLDADAGSIRRQVAARDHFQRRVARLGQPTDAAGSKRKGAKADSKENS